MQKTHSGNEVEEEEVMVRIIRPEGGPICNDS